MKNRIYTMCNGNDIVNNLKEIPAEPENGEDEVHGLQHLPPGEPHQRRGEHRDGGGEPRSTASCATPPTYDYRQRKPFKDEKGRVVMGQDRSVKAAMAVGKPGVKNCMICHEAAGGGVLVKRGFSFTKETDVHAAKGMVCVDCHGGEGPPDPDGLRPEQLGQRRRAGRLRGLPRREAPQGRGCQPPHGADRLPDVPHPPDRRRGGEGLHEVDPGVRRVLRAHHAPHGGQRDGAGVRLVQPDRGQHPALHRPEGKPGGQGRAGSTRSRCTRGRRTSTGRPASSSRWISRRRWPPATPSPASPPPRRLGMKDPASTNAGPRLADGLLRQQPPRDEGEGPFLRELPRAERRPELQGRSATPSEEIRKLTSAGIYFDKMTAKQKEEW